MNKQNLTLQIKSKKGFTLIELLVVVAIIAILAVIGIAVFTNVQKNARDARRKSDIDSIANAIEATFIPNTGAYGAVTGTSFAGGTFPQDPANTGTSIYTFNGAAITVPFTPAAGWNVCAVMESGIGGNYNAINAVTPTASGQVYCRKAQTS